jgi:DNA-binding MarR family transcriptional regulator
MCAEKPAGGEDRATMKTRSAIAPTECHCLAVRQAARHVTSFYDRFMAPFGLRSTQFSILSVLRRAGPLSINALAAELVMDRTTMGRNVRPLQRGRLVTAVVSRNDRRSRLLQLTPRGRLRIAQARKGWAKAQAGFETAVGKARARELRAVLRSVSGSELRQ